MDRTNEGGVMGTETRQDRRRSAEDKLADLGRRIDGIHHSARGHREKVNRNVERHLDAVRAKDAQVRTELRQMAEEDEAAWNAYFDELDAELNELDAQVAVTESQIAASEAEDWAAFERAIEEELAADDRLLEASRERAARAKDEVRSRSNEAVAHARDKAKTVGDALKRRRAEAAHGWESKRDEIRAEMDAVDATVTDAVAGIEADMLDERYDRER
jgi:uncharacterized protein YeaO (DUF488 family)